MARPVEDTVHLPTLDSDKQTGWENQAFGFHGPIGSGKTTFACSVSEGYPDDFPSQIIAPDAEPIYNCTDVGFLSFDAGSVVGFKRRGIRVKNFDCVEFMTKPDVYKAHFKYPPSPLQTAQHGLNRLLSEGVKWLVVDTVSALDQALISYWFKSMSDEKDPRKVWGMIGNNHAAFSEEVMKLPTGLILLFHSKAVEEAKDDNADAKQETLSTANRGQICPQVSGQSKAMYLKNLNILGAVVSKKKVREIITGGSRRYETKNRFEGVIEDREFPHFRKMLRKVTG